MDPAHGDFNGYFGGEHDEFRMPGRVFVQGVRSYSAHYLEERRKKRGKLTFLAMVMGRIACA
jgi:hypothetical protein